jgi:hypothetical protein
MGNAKHKTDCGCGPCSSARAGRATRELEREATATYRATAKAVVALCARLAGGELSGPDILRRLVGEDAELVLRAAGIDPAPVVARWHDSAPVRQSTHQSRTAGMWAASPDHGPRVVQAIVRGAPDTELNAIRAGVMAEHQERAAGRRQPALMWRTRSGELVTDGAPAVLGASMGPAGAPVQRSIVHTDVPEPGSE